MSSRSECGTMTNRTSIRAARVIIVGHGLGPQAYVARVSRAIHHADGCPKMIESGRPATRATLPVLLPSRRRHLPRGRTMRIAAPWISRLGRTAAGTALVASGAALPLHAQAPTAVDAAPTDRALESSVAPGDDFFAYANAGWL